MPEAERYAIRKEVAKLVTHKKLTQITASYYFGLDKNTVCEWLKRYKAGGFDALRSKKKGRNPADMKLLTASDENQIQKLLIDKHPEQYKLDFALWTCRAVKELIEQKLKKVLGRTTVCDYLRSWGFTPQKPAKRAYEQCPKKVQQFLDVDYPAIKERAKIENVEIYWGDETGVKNSCQHGRSYAPKGKTPVAPIMSKHLSINMVSAITNQGKVQFLVYLENMNSAKLTEFMQLLIKSSTCKVFLILDNLKVHHSHITKDWVAENKEKIELFYLPSYSPELNPDEYLNGDLKKGLANKRAPKNEKQLTKNVTEHMKMLQKKPERGASYFKHKSIKYAA